MKKIFLAVLCVLAISFLNAAPPPKLNREILGISVGASKTKVKARLQEIGKFVRDESKRQEVWEVRDPRFSHLVVGFDAKETLRYVTAVAREDKEAKRVAYAEVGDLKSARQAGSPAINNFNYEWTLPAEKDAPAVLLIVRGRDPEFLSTYSLKRVIEDSETPEEDD